VTNQISCPHCGQTYFVQPEQWAQYNGRTINCTRCGQPFVVTAPPEMAMPPAPAFAPPPPPGIAPPYTPPPPGGMGPGLAPPQPPYPPYPSQMYGPPKVTSGWAIASLVGGILGFCIPPGCLLGIIGGIVGLVKTSRPGMGGRGMSIAGLVLGLVGLLVGIPIWTSAIYIQVTQKHEQANRHTCELHLKDLGRSLIAYANSHQGQFPDTLEELAKTMPPSAAIARDFVCPSTTQTPPATSSPEALANDISSGMHCSYFYTGKGLRLDATPDTVLMYEPLSNHQREGMNVLFADGNVRWLNADEADQVIQQHFSSTQPIRVTPGGE